jgi:hypothetical protein
MNGGGRLASGWTLEIIDAPFSFRVIGITV